MRAGAGRHCPEPFQRRGSVTRAGRPALAGAPRRPPRRRMSRGGEEAGDVRPRLLRALAAVPHDGGAAWGALAECLEKLQALDGSGVDGVARDMPADWEWAAVFRAAADALGGPNQALYAPEAPPSLAGDGLSTSKWQSAARTYF